MLVFLLIVILSLLAFFILLTIYTYHDTFVAKIQSLKEEIKSLDEEIKSREEDLQVFECGLYQPHFNFDASARYKIAINANYASQKDMIKRDTAIEYFVNGGKVKGVCMLKQTYKLMLRAFNGECDSIIEKVTWNNVNKMEVRIKKAFDDINAMGQSKVTFKNHCLLNDNYLINNNYLRLKLEELYLTYEYANKQQEEKEEQARIRELIREEERVQRECEKAQKDAENEEKRYQKALEKVRLEMENATGEEINKYKNQLEILEQQLKEAQERKERAISQAQLTKAGHIYVISNIGSFGEDVYKIGMTRRLEPMDRVIELGGASVPFRFDVHALIYSDNAPELEHKLHQFFDNKRVNLVNNRREFFNVSLEEIQKVVTENHGDFEFTKVAEAREFRETEEIKKQYR
ncbi:MAG: DUF4041 domain-containing protein [Thermoguttaceae bacterium]